MRLGSAPNRVSLSSTRRLRQCAGNVPRPLARGLLRRTIPCVMRIGAGAFAAALVAVVSAGSTAQGATRATHHVSLARSPCTAPEVRSVVAKFIVNFNDGDLQQVNRLFSPAGLF